MSLSARLSLLMLGSCLLPLGAAAEPLLRGTLDAAAEASPGEDGLKFDPWSLRLERADAVSPFSNADMIVSRVSNRRTNRTPPTPPPPQNTTGANVLVAVVDTGILTSHSEFAGRIAPGGACFGSSAACSGSLAFGDDDHGHGTHVAGIIGAAADGRGTTGLATGSLLLPVRVLDADGGGTATTVAQGISHAAQQGARVINLSLGGNGPAPEIVAPLQTAAPTAVIVAAAGNSGNALSPAYPAAYATQAGIAGSMLVVGSVNSANRISSFSQTPGNGGCVTAAGIRRCLRDVFLVAPGERILSTYLNNGYASASGTSMATPHVAGAAALVIGAAPYLTSRQVVDILLRSATDLGRRGTDEVYGRGLLNVKAALAPIGSQTIATSGGWTSSYSGSGQVSSASISGPLAAGLRTAATLRAVTFFDDYGRDFQTDLTTAVAPAAVSLTDRINASSWSSQFISFSGDRYSAQGFVSDTTRNSVTSLGFAEQPQDNLSDMVVTVQLSDTSSLRFGHNASVEGLVNRLDLASDPRFDGLFMQASALNSPFLSLAGGGEVGAAAFRLGDAATLTFGHARVQVAEDAVMQTSVMASDAQLAQITDPVGHERSAQSSVAVLSWQLAPWAMTGLSLGMTEEENSLLGTRESGAFAMTSDASTLSVGGAARFNLGTSWTLSASWSAGRTEASPEAGSIIQSYSDISSQAYGLAIARQNIFNSGDSLGFAVSRPLHITEGTATILASTGVTNDRGIVYGQETVSLASATPETDFELGYSTLVSVDTLVTANLIYQQNAGGEAGEDAIAGLVTVKTRW